MIDVAAAQLTESQLSPESEATLDSWIETHDEPMTVVDCFEVDTQEPTVSNPRRSPDTLRSTRETLKISRAVLQQATGLSSSVIWRAEQAIAKPITDDEYKTIWTVLDKWLDEGVPAEYARPVKVERTAAHSITDSATVRYADFVTGLRQSVEDKIIVARQVKGRTKELTQLLGEINNFLNGIAE